MSVFYIDGQYRDADASAIPATDLSILRGYGVFDFLRTYGGIPFQLRAHLRRLQRSAALIELDCAWDIEELADIVLGTLYRNKNEESGIRIVVTGGDSPNGFMPAGASRLLVMVRPAQNLPAAAYEKGAAIATVEQQRILPEAKTINYIPGIMAQRRAERRVPGAIDAVYTVDGRVIEGTRSNTFVFKDGRWITPASGLLLGVTRAEVIKLLESDGKCEIRDVTLDEYYGADEIILTSSTKEIVPIVQVDDVAIGGGAPGPQSRRLMAQWREMTAAYAAAGVVE